MAAITLGQMLEIALGSSRTGTVDFEQLYNLLNGLLLHLGLKELLVQENGEPLEGAEESPFAFLKELKQRLEANEKELAEVRTHCQELRAEVVDMKAEQSRIAEDMQKMMDNIDVENFQNLLEDLRKQVLEAVLASMNQDEHGWMKDHSQTGSWDDAGLIVIGNEITLLERAPIPRHVDTQPSTPVSPTSKTPVKEKDSLEANGSSPLLSNGEDDMGQNGMGQNGMGQNGMGWNRRHSGMGQNSMGHNDMGQNGMGWNRRHSGMGQKGMGWNTEQNDMGQNDMGQNETGWNRRQSGMGRKGKGWSALSSDTGRNNMEQIKDEEDLISKTPPHMHRKSPNGGFTASGMHPGAPGTLLPVQRVQSGQGHPGSPTPWIPAENGAGTSKHPTSKEGHRGSSPSKTESLPAEDGLMLLKMPSSEYSPCDQLVITGQHCGIIPSTPPPSPGLSGRLPHAKKSRKKEPREQADKGSYVRSPRYCGGKHTSTFSRHPMEPLLPDPNKPGVVELVGTDGLVYRGRTTPGTDSAQDPSPHK